MIDPVTIEPEALYDDASLRQSLGLSPTALSSARRSGTLRHIRKGKRTLYKGVWVLAWLESESEPRVQVLEPSKEAAGREDSHAG